MADPFITLEYSDKAVREKLQQLQRKIGDLTPAMKNIGEYLLLATDQRFEKEVDPNGVPWIPSSPRTLAKKKAMGRITRVLQNTGRGRASIAYRADRNSVVVGTNVGYMADHQLGRKVPKREFLGVSKEDEREIVAILDDFLAG